MWMTTVDVSRIFVVGALYAAQYMFENGEPGTMRLLGERSTRTGEGEKVRGKVTVVPKTPVDTNAPGRLDASAA